MGWIGRKLRRFEEARTVTRLSSDSASWRTLAGCYGRLLTGLLDETIVSARCHHGALDHRLFFRRTDIFTFGEIFFERQYQLRSALPPRPVVIDGGANIGLFSFSILGQAPGAEVHAFEPAPDNFSLLKQNLGELPAVTINQAAIGAVEGSIELFLAEHGAEHSVIGTGAGGRSISVPCLRLDSYLAAHGIGRIDLLKLDVEGSEAAVIEGLGERLRDVQVIVGELHETLVDETAFYSRLEAAGFERRSQTRSPDTDVRVHTFELARSVAP